MQDSDLMMEGFNLMLLGMGFVFVFLAVLVIATTLMSRIILRYSKPEPVAVASGARKPAASGSSNPDLIAAISAAIHMHRQRQEK